METIPDVILEKINDYVTDLFFQDHTIKFKTTLKSIVKIHGLYIRNRISYRMYSRWKIRHNDGIYRILRYSGDVATHWINIHDDIIDGRRPMNIGSEWYTLLKSF